MSRRGQGEVREREWLVAIVVQSLAIVLSILLASWVDQYKQHRAEHDLAVVSMSNFLNELHQNESRLDDILPYHKGMRTLLASQATSHSIRTEEDFQSAVGIDGLRPPSLLQTAWQTAVATGAVTHLDYETVSVLSLTYTLQDRFREDSRTGIQSLIQASNFAPGHADPAIRAADSYVREMVGSEEDLRATYVQAEQIVRKKLNEMGAPAPADSSSAVTSPGTTGSKGTTAAPGDSR